MTVFDKLLFPVTLAAVLGSGLIAGLFFAFSAFVMKALARLPAEQGIAAMRAINSAILNPLFFTVFFGTAAASLFAIVFAVLHRNAPHAAYLLAGGILYLAGSFLVTAVFNVPLNNALAAVAPESEEGARVWTRYVANWTAWNHVRTLATLAAAAAFALALSHRPLPP